eukprot:9493387-Pyramimonas_sp.AAC.3
MPATPPPASPAPRARIAGGPTVSAQPLVDPERVETVPRVRRSGARREVTRHLQLAKGLASSEANRGWIVRAAVRTTGAHYQALASALLSYQEKGTSPLRIAAPTRDALPGELPVKGGAQADI